MSSPAETAEFRRVLSHFPTGVVVITGMTGGRPVGLAVGSFASISLEPRLVGFFVAEDSTSWPPIRPSGHFCVNLLADEQSELCSTFARSGGDKFTGVEWEVSGGGAPILSGVVAWIDCALKREVQTGDHTLVIGEVLDLAVARAHSPMLFHRNAYPRLEPV